MAIQQLESLAQCSPKSPSHLADRMTCGALQYMPPNLRNILVACHLERRSHAEIGRAFGVDEDEIASVYREALRRFTSILAAMHAALISYDIYPGDTGTIIDGAIEVQSSSLHNPSRAK